MFGFTPASLAGYQPAAGLGEIPAPVTILTSMFLHGGLLHIGGNMLYLWIFGNNAEDAMGHSGGSCCFFCCAALPAALTLA